MCDHSAFRSPLDYSKDLATFPLHGSFGVGEWEVIHVTDGLSFGSRQFWFSDVDPAEWMKPLSLTDPATAFPVNYGLFVVRGPEGVVLVDSGWGPGAKDLDPQRGAGELVVRLAELGIAPTDVDVIVQTHLHSDHCGHLTNVGEDGQSAVTFPRARVLVHEQELQYWMSAVADENPMSSYVRERVGPVAAAGLIETFSAQTTVLNGLEAVPMVGHTPGHACVLVSSMQDHCLLVGDLAHNPVHLVHHDWHTAFDFDRDAARRSRAELADLAIQLDAVITAPHMPILTLGRLRRGPGPFGVVYSPVEPR
jgi:glyoxylase-like metal-dependent hydrolase (beta-lactamase superfamily II)